MNYENIEIAAGLFESAPDDDCEVEAMDLYYEIRDVAKAVDYLDKKALSKFVEDVRKICINAGLTATTATSFAGIAEDGVYDAYIPF